jgi:hypothetical protein
MAASSPFAALLDRQKVVDAKLRLRDARTALHGQR